MHIYCMMWTGVSILLSLAIWCPLALQQTAEKLDFLEGPPQCAIIQETRFTSVNISLPTFLRSQSGSQCQVQSSDIKRMLRCGQTDVYLKPECVCSFYNVYDATSYHAYSSCPEGSESDIVTQLKCHDCKRYSFNNTGPCINGGTLICKGDEVAPTIHCSCPPNYKGMFCEEKVDNVTRICDRISKSSSLGLHNCRFTRRKCVTYSRNMTYVFICNEFRISQRRRGKALPLCIDVEDFIHVPVTMPAAIEVSDAVSAFDKSTGSPKKGGFLSTSACEIDCFGNIGFILCL